MPLAASLALLGGCAQFSPDGGQAAVARLTQAQAGSAPADWRQPERVDVAGEPLLTGPLQADTAVALALLRHRGLQARLAELGITEAALVQAGRWSGPTLRWGRLAGGGALELDRGLSFNLWELLTLPLEAAPARQQAASAFTQAQWQAAAEAVTLAADTRRAWVRAVAAQELRGYAQQVLDAAEAADELARGMKQAGNFNTLQQLREQAFLLDARTQRQRAEREALQARLQLARLLGLAATPDRLQLPARLPALPQAPLAPASADTLVQQALDQRLDLQRSRLAVQAQARAMDLGRQTGWINALDGELQDQRNRGEPRKAGMALQLSLPWFDFGAAGRAGDQARYLQAVHQAADQAEAVRTEVTQAHAAYLAAYALARQYRDEALPLRRRMAEEQLLRVNGMLASVFELLADAREQVGTVIGAVEALREHWLAQIDLQQAAALPVTPDLLAAQP